MLILTVYVFIGILHTAIGEPFLDKTPLTINSIEGRQVVLPCVVKNLGYASIIWFSPSGAPIAKDANLYTQDERVSIQQPYNTDFNIVIENVKESDQGIYICMVIGGMDEKRITLIIKSPPKLENQRSSPNAIIIGEYETLTLKCYATGKPSPVISWYRTVETDDGQMTKEDLSTTGSVLTIKNIERENAGSYECVASNNLPPDVSREMIVTVHYKPAIYATKTDRFSKKPGQTVILECIAEGYPLPHAKWQRNGKTIPRTQESLKFRQTVYETKDTLILSLRIDNLNNEDFGIYTCEAGNVYGFASHDFTVEKTGAPKIEVASTLIRKMKSENAELECLVRGFPRSVVWFKDGQRLTADRHNDIENYQEDEVYVSSLTILTLSSADFSVYICQAENEYGSDEMEIRLEQSALDISGPAEAKVGQEISLVCNATTDSLGDDTITWLKNGQMLRTSSRITMSRDINVEEQRIYSKLYIRDMKIGDKGTYTCKTENFLMKSHSLSILQLPDEFINIDRTASSQENIVVKENSGTFTLSCKVEAYPRKMVYWLRYMGMSDGRETYTELSSGDEMLTLNSDRSVTGRYRCRASNGKQAEQTLDINVDIQYPVKVSVTSNRIKNVIGMPLIIECNITGNPIIRKFWAAPKGLNATFDHILDIETHEYYVIAVMKIMELKLEDFGAYTCVGGNHLGNDSIKVAVMPIFPTTTTTTTTTTTMATTEKSTVQTTAKITAAPIVVTTTRPITVTETAMHKTIPPPTTAEPTHRPLDKEHVKQDDDSKSSCITSSYLLVTLTVLLTFRCIYHS